SPPRPRPLSSTPRLLMSESEALPIEIGIRPQTLLVRHPHTSRLRRRRQFAPNWRPLLGWMAVSCFGLCGNAWAIPSPDLVINVFASSAQVLALASVVFGSWFFGSARKSRRGGKG